MSKFTGERIEFKIGLYDHIHERWVQASKHGVFTGWTQDLTAASLFDNVPVNILDYLWDNEKVKVATLSVREIVKRDVHEGGDWHE